MDSEKPRKYNNPDDLNELCRRFLMANNTDPGAAIDYCKSFLMVLNEKRSHSGSVLSYRAKSH